MSRMSSKASPIEGAILRAGASRSFVVECRNATSACGSQNGARGRTNLRPLRASRAEKPRGGHREQPDLQESTASPEAAKGSLFFRPVLQSMPQCNPDKREHPRRATRQYPISVSRSISSLHKDARLASTAAASADPPPKPEATGRFFSERDATDGGRSTLSASKQQQPLRTYDVVVSGGSIARTANSQSVSSLACSSGGFHRRERQKATDFQIVIPRPPALSATWSRD